jgi:hypothetical protein
MATVGSRGEPGGGGSEPGVSASIRKMADRARQTFQAARLAAQLRRVPVVPGPIAEAVPVAPVVLHRDLLNVVGSPPGGSTEVQFVRDADLRLRAYVVGGGGGGSLPPGGKGDILYFDGSDWIGLPVGSAGEVLTSDGTNPFWDAASGGGVSVAAAMAISSLGI